MGYTLSVTDAPAEADVLHIQQGLVDFNREQAGDDDYQPLVILVRDESGAPAGGLIGATYWDWLVIEILWLPADLRGQGIGQQVVQAAEQEAIRRGCTHAHLDTLSFQAPDFYGKLGYEVFGQIDGLPPGHRRIYMQKKLVK